MKRIAAPADPATATKKALIAQAKTASARDKAKPRSALETDAAIDAILAYLNIKP